MKRYIIILAAIVFGGISLNAQELIIPEGFEVKDSVIYRPTAVLDSTLVGVDIFALLPKGNPRDAEISISQPGNISKAMDAHIANNATKNITGYRVRIFFDNKQDSRQASEAALKRFESTHPGVAAYRSFVSPFFKVTVGDFRTKSEAMQLLQSLTADFPSAFVVKENIKYPIVDKSSSYIVDTLLVLKPCSNKD